GRSRTTAFPPPRRCRSSCWQRRSSCWGRWASYRDACLAMSNSGEGAATLSPGPSGRLTRRSPSRDNERATERAARARRLTVRTIALGYLALLLLTPVAMIFYRTFEHGLA